MDGLLNVLSVNNTQTFILHSMIDCMDKPSANITLLDFWISWVLEYELLQSWSGHIICHQIRLLTRTRKRERLTFGFFILAAAKIQNWVKVLLMFFKALHGIGLKYIVDILIPYQNTRNMRTSSQMILHVPKTRFKSKGDRDFAVAALHLWNPLPKHFKPSPSVDSFKV